MATKAKRAGRPRLPGKGKGQSPFIGWRCGEDMLSRIDKYRKAQEGQPNRSEALRRLADVALTAAGY